MGIIRFRLYCIRNSKKKPKPLQIIRTPTNEKANIVLESWKMKHCVLKHTENEAKKQTQQHKERYDLTETNTQHKESLLELQMR